VLAILNVGRSTVPLQYFPVLVLNRDGTSKEPAVDSIRTANAHLLFERLTAGKTVLQPAHDPVQILGMNSFFPRLFGILHKRKAAGVFVPSPVHKFRFSIGPGNPGHGGNAFDGFAQLPFFTAELVDPQVMTGPEQRAENKQPERAEPRRFPPGGRDENGQ
jgi:hypothetical protein